MTLIVIQLKANLIFYFILFKLNNMAQAKRSPFIEGFKQPTLTKNNFVTLADIRGDGEGKLVIWSDQQSQLIVYKGSNRQLEKPSKIKNVSGIINYFDESRNPKAVVAMSAQNGLYIFRSMNQSFRLRVPDVLAREDEQILWSQHQNNPDKLSQQFMKIPKKYLSQTARHFISATTVQRKLQLVQKVFTDGINEKDSISAICSIRQNPNSIGNLVLGTELNRLYILDCYGHTILEQRVIDSAPVILLGHGAYLQNFVIVSIDREGEVSFHLKANKQQSDQKLKLSSRVISADLSYPQLIICTQDQVVTMYTISSSFSKLHSKKYSFKLAKQPIKVILVDYKSSKMSFVVFQDQFRMYNEKQMLYSFTTQHKMYDLLFGSFAKQENCIIIMYESHGFEVLILHRQFNPKQSYGTNKRNVQSAQEIAIPKKTTQFKAYWDTEKDATHSYKLYERNIKLLKWMTYRQKFSQRPEGQVKLKINSKVLGLGPDFTIKLTIQYLSEQPLKNTKITSIYDRNSLKLIKLPRQISMLSPNTDYNLDIKIISLSLKNQTIDFQFLYANNCSKTTVHLPSCQQFADQ